VKKRPKKDRQHSSMSPEDENKEKETLAFTVRYRTADLKRLSILAKSTQIGARHLLRALLPALLEAYESQGKIELPLAVVSRREALAAGLSNQNRIRISGKPTLGPPGESQG